VRYLSLCSGIEAASCAWKPLGWEAVAFSEIEPFPSAVLAHHYPDVPNLGDMTKWREWDIDGLRPVDLVVGGTPCQSFSVAGLRGGMADPRGNLALEFLAIVDAVRPKWVVWENVPGVLSSGGGRDFGSFLGALGQLGYGWAYRVLDAQYFGVAQRRRRVFVVGCLGDWRSASAVLLERNSLSRNPPPRREPRQGTARGSAAGTGGDGEGLSLARRLRARANASHRLDSDTYVAAPLVARQGKGAFCDPVNDNILAVSIDEECNAAEEVRRPLLRGGQGGTHQAVAFTQNTRDEVRLIGGDGQLAGALGAEPGMKQQTYVQAFTQNQAGDVLTGGVAASMGTNQNATGRNTPKVHAGMQVRRLLPVECCRLQGFPDDYLVQVAWRGKTPPPDGPMYKALGNSMAVPCMRWIGERIAKVQEAAP
jgi:DNA (cytosine-5)-methyltransferase 1